jgi:hypothetical protein
MKHTTVQDRPFEDRLLEMLLEAHEERRRRVTGRRRRASMRRRGIGALMAATLVVGGWVAASSVVSDDTIEVDAAAAVEDPRAVERELREAGIDADVRTVPEPDPYLRGKWIWLHFPPRVDIDPDTFALLQSYVGMLDMGWPSVQERCPRGIGCERTAILELPRNLPGPIVLIAGRAPRAGEEGWKNLDPMNELAPTGALYCYRLEELSPTEAGRRLDELGYRVEWRYATSGDPFWAPAGAPPNEHPDSPPPGTGLVYAWFLGPNSAELSVAPQRYVEEVRRQYGTPVTEADRSLGWAPNC